MRILVLGADGMLGHEMVRTAVTRGHDVFAATRKPPDVLVAKALQDAEVVSGVDVRDIHTVQDILTRSRANVVVNAAGIVKQRQAAHDAIESIAVNSLFPHQLAALCRNGETRLIHISTDCVFSGRRGGYDEGDLPDPLDLYGRSKLLGEIADAGSVTLRTSIIGLELANRTGLVEWFLDQSGSAPGWTKALYSGVTTQELARVILRIVRASEPFDGLWHLSGDPISKFDLLIAFREALGRSIEVVPDPSVSIDRTLRSDRLREALGYAPPSWPEMLADLADAVRARERDAG